MPDTDDMYIASSF